MTQDTPAPQDNQDASSFSLNRREFLYAGALAGAAGLIASGCTSDPNATAARSSDPETIAAALRDAGADLLVHEATLADPGRAAHYGHSTPVQAAEVARAARVRRLVLTHFSQRHDAEKLLAMARDVFPATEAARDLLRLRVRAGITSAQNVYEKKNCK